MDRLIDLFVPNYAPDWCAIERGTKWAKGKSFKDPVCPKCRRGWKAILSTKDSRRRPTIGVGLVPAHLG